MNPVQVDFRSLPPGTVLAIDTLNSSYRVVVLDGETGRATMQGGALLREPTQVRLEGSTAGGNTLMIGRIGLGLHLELFVWHQRVVTSRVRAIRFLEFRGSILDQDRDSFSGLCSEP